MTTLELYLDSLQRFGMKPGLERIRALLECTGDPQLRYPIVLVGGTNGKGSTCEFLAHLLAATGRCAGLYTSPHMYRWNERIRVLEGERRKDEGGKEANSGPSLFTGAISDAELDELLSDAKPYLESVAAQYGQTTEFETLTLLGLWHFARVKIEVAVVEVGLGGRWDATNAVEPAVSVITHVALDHCDRLGKTLEAIARDKVEISRPGHILVTAETKPVVLDVFAEHASAHEVMLWPLLAPGWSNDGENLRRAFDTVPDYTNAATPEFQVINQQTAAVALRALEQTLGWEPAPLSAAAPPPVPGRLEELRQRPTLLIDGANNPDGAAQLAVQLNARRRANPEARLTLVLGILLDKDYAAMIEQLAPLADCVIATCSPSPRAAGADLVATEARRYCGQVEVVEPVAAAVERALQIAAPEDIVCVTGSFYTIAEVPREF